jgi:hypothetical protein
VKKAIGLLARRREPHGPAVSAFIAITRRIIEASRQV